MNIKDIQKEAREEFDEKYNAWVSPLSNSGYAQQMNKICEDLKKTVDSIIDLTAKELK